MSEPCIVYITDTETGETRSDTTHEWHSDEEWPDFIWSEGNLACDCNRGLFFERVAGKDAPDRSCGCERYHVRITRPDGSLLYEEDGR